MKKSLMLLGLMATTCFTLTAMRPGEKCRGVMCATQYVREGIVILDTDGEPVTLDEAYTYNTATGEKIRFRDFKVGDAYTVLDDSYQEKLAHQTVRFRFVGIRNGKRVVNEPFVFSADCCHIIKQGGKDTIIVERD